MYSDLQGQRRVIMTMIYTRKSDHISTRRCCDSFLVQLSFIGVLKLANFLAWMELLLVTVVHFLEVLADGWAWAQGVLEPWMHERLLR